MPTSLLHRNAMNNGEIDEQRAYQLALELSLLGLNGQGMTIHSNSHPDDDFNHHDNDYITPEINFINKDSIHAFGATTRKSANMTEAVPVPSSEHVAEIVGRQGE